MSAQVGVSLHPTDSRPKRKEWYEKPIGIVFITVISGIILIFIGHLVNKYILNESAKK